MDIRTRDDRRCHQREMLIDDQVVCWLTVIDYSMRIGCAPVRMAGIGGVKTRPEHRMKGLMRILFEDTVRYMTEQGYDVSMLFGIPNFYTKFGYATCLPGPRTTVQTRDAEAAQAGALPYRARAVESGDLPGIIALYNQRSALRTCSLVRSGEYFTGIPRGTNWWQKAESVVIETPEGGFIGYAAWDEESDRVSVTEVEAVDERYFATLLSEFARQAVAKRCGAIDVRLPPDHPFAEYVQRFGCEWTIRHARHGDGMLCLLNQASLFQKIEPELQRRWSMARTAGLSGGLTIETELGATTLTVGPAGLQVAAGPGAGNIVRLPQDKLIQLLVGYRSARDVLHDGAHTNGDVRPWLEALFPKDWPFVWSADEF